MVSEIWDYLFRRAVDFQSLRFFKLRGLKKLYRAAQQIKTRKRRNYNFSSADHKIRRAARRPSFKCHLRHRFFTSISFETATRSRYTPFLVFSSKILLITE